MTSPGASTGIPGGYGATSSALILPTAAPATTVSLAAKNASRGAIAISGDTDHAGDGSGRRGTPRRRSMMATSAAMNRATESSLSASVMIGTIMSRSPSSTGIPAAIRSASTAYPSAPAPASSTTSLAGSTPGPSSTATPGTSAS